MNKLKNKKGFSLIEILLSISIFAIFSIGVFYLSLDTVSNDAKMVLNNQALFYAQEGIEATRNMRDVNYLSLTNGDHGVALENGSWTFVPAPENIEDFYFRTVTVDDIYRNMSGEIDSEGTIYDPESKKVTSEVLWYQNGVIPRSVELVTYLSNWRGDDWLEETCEGFNAGTFEGTMPVILPSPPADNCGIQIESEELASTFFASANMGKHGTDVDVDGNYAYLTLNSNKDGFNVIDISNPQNPHKIDSFDIGHKGRYVFKDGSYVYIGVAKANGGLSILDVSSPSNVSELSNVNLGGYGNQAAVINNILLMAVASANHGLAIYDISSKSSPQLIDTLDLGDEVFVIKTNGNYAYLGTAYDHEGLIVLDVSDPNNVQKVGTLDTGEEVNAIVLNGPLAYIGTEDSGSSLKVIDISDPRNPSLVSSLNVNGEIQDLTINGDYLYAAVDKVHNGLAAINISDAWDPYFVYSLNAGGKATGIDSQGGYIYVTTDTANKGLVVIGTTEAEILLNGAYISRPLNTGSIETLYNFVEWSYTEAPGTSVKLQLRTASSEAGLESAAWAGPDGSSSTYYEDSRSPIVVAPGTSGTQYCQFKIYIDSDGVSTPIVESVRINYTP